MKRFFSTFPRSAANLPLQAMLVVSFLLAPGLGAAAKEVTLDAQIGGDAKHTRFVAFLSKKVDFRVFFVADPYRIVIDLPEVDIQVPADRPRGLVLSSRAGLLAEGKSRIVIDLIDPALVEKSEILPPDNGLPARLVLELERASHKAFMAASELAGFPAQVKSEPKPAEAEAKDAGDLRPLIIIDPGHGGVDGGALGHATRTVEKDITFDFCQTLKDHLEKTGRYRIAMTRAIDVFVPLDERAQFAAERKADLLISIHADALDPKLLGAKGLQEVRGATVYTLSEKASDEQAKALAIRENKADSHAGLAAKQSQQLSAEIEIILSDLENRHKKNRSLAFANYLVDHLKDTIRFNVRPHRSADFRVLKSEGVPAVLFELGYLSNDEDEKLLTSKEWRAKTAEHLANAVSGFLAERQARLPF